MDNIKESFQKVKQDILSLGQEISSLKLELIDMKTELKLVSGFLDDLKLKMIEKEYKESSKPVQQIGQKTPTIQQINSTYENIPTDKLPSQVLKGQFSQSSIGNDGVPTDRQTNQQTDRHTIQHINKPQKESKIDHLERAAEILDNLDSLKKEIRRKFKALTSQEMSVFSLIYQLESQGNQVDYPLLSSELKLSESSIRDYILKIQKKGVPIMKEKLNNKRIILHISQDLRKIASLDTILKLREI